MTTDTADEPSLLPVELSEQSEIVLHDLGFKNEGDGRWIVGRRDGGEYVELPDIAISLIRALQEERSIGSARARVEESEDVSVDVLDFVHKLVDLDYIEYIDGRMVSPAGKPPSLRWLRPEHVRWMFSLPVGLVIGLVIATGILCGIARGEIIPAYQIIFFSRHMSVVVAVNTAMALTGIALHEFAHLAAARSVGVPARLGIGTRMQFLVAQTDVSGMWLASRPARIKVHLAGMTSDLFIAACASIAISVFDLHGLPRRLLEIIILILFLAVTFQTRVYLRTDLYFALQEVLRCKNLNEDGWLYVRHRIFGRLSGRSGNADRADTVAADRTAREHRSLKIYTIFMAIASGVSLWRFVTYSGPTTIAVFSRSLQNSAQGIWSGEWLLAGDGLVVLLIEGSFLLLFLIATVRKHGHKLGRLVRVIRRSETRHRAGSP